MRLEIRLLEALGLWGLGPSGGFSLLISRMLLWSTCWLLGRRAAWQVSQRSSCCPGSPRFADCSGLTCYAPDLQHHGQGYSANTLAFQFLLFFSLYVLLLEPSLELPPTIKSSFLV